MSSKKDHINITRDNYEEFFLLYIDNELSPADKQAVDNFILLHPDLQEELELLEGTKLETETLVFNEKEALLSHSFQLTSIDESLLLYLDNELDHNEKKRVAFELAGNPAYRHQYEQLKSARLDENEQLVCPFKNELYRTETSRRPLPWLRIAAALILLLGAGSLVILNNNRKTGPQVAIETKNNVERIEPRTQQITPVENQTATVQNMIAQKNQPVRMVVKKQDNISTGVAVKKDIPQDLPSPIVPDNAIAATTTADIKAAGSETTVKTDVINSGAEQQQSVNTGNVTSDNLTPYNNTIAATNTVSKTGTDNSDGKQGSVRGLLRKATRFIERRTGINPVNDDDKLLVGMVAISLK